LAKFLSLDPGGTTGYAIFEYEEDSVAVVLEAGHVPGGLKGFIKWYGNQVNTRWDKVVCESFTLRTGVKFPDLSPVYIIGALEAFEEAWDSEVVYQPPTSKPLCNDDVLKKLGIYLPGKGHANDALRHGIIYLRNKRHLPTIRRAWPLED
jgi:hypothetical protein